MYGTPLYKPTPIHSNPVLAPEHTQEEMSRECPHIACGSICRYLTHTATVNVPCFDSNGKYIPIGDRTGLPGKVY